MKELAALLAGFNYASVFDAIGQVSLIVAASITPILLLISIHIRLMETQLDGLTRGSKWGDALRDILVFSFVLGVYFEIGGFVTQMLNPVYAWIDGVSSMDNITGAMDDVLKQHQLDNTASDESTSLWDTLSGAMTPLTLIYLGVSALLYYGTMFLLAFLTAFLKFGHALIFGVAFIWGLIAIPVSVSQSLKILRGWALLLGFALAWPIVQGLMLMFLHAVLVDTGADVIQATGILDLTDIANLYMLMAVMHLLLCAVLVAAPFITNALISNAPAGFGASMPFVAAAAAAAKMSWTAARQGGAGASRSTSSTHNAQPTMSRIGGGASSLHDAQPKPQRTSVKTDADRKQDRRGYFANRQKKLQQEKSET
jgi:hypothetical protein